MATETTHTLKFRADAREVKVLDQTISKAFDPRKSREFNRELGGLQRRLKDITAAQVGLVKELQRTDQGTAAYKRLNNQLASVENQAKVVQRAITAVTAAFKDLRSEQGRGAAGAFAGVGAGFGGGGAAPSRGGMGRGIAGGIIAGGIMSRFGRRAYTGAMAPFQNPGIGGLTTMLGAIPVVGPMAGGAVQALAGMYQEAVAYNQARVANLAFVGDAVARAQKVGAGRMAGLPGGRRRAAGALDWDDRIKRAHAEYRAAQQDVVSAEREEALASKQRINVSGLSKKERGILKAQIANEKIGGLSGGATGAFGQAASLGKPSIVEDRKRVSRQIRMDSEARLEEAKQNFIDESRAFDERRATVEGKRRAARDRKNWGRPFIPGVGYGARFGFRAAETQSAFTGFMQAAGGSSVGAERPFEGALAANRLYGVQFQQAGAFERMGRAGGGGTGMSSLARTLQMATTMGLEGSLVPEYLQTLVGLGQQAEKQGVKINVGEFGRSSALLRSVGIQGPQIGRIGGALQGAAMDLSQRGVSNPADMILMRAAGYDPGKGVESYAESMNKLAGGMDLDTLNNLMEIVTRGAKGGIGASGRQTSILMLRRYMGRMKIPVGPGQASKLLDAYSEGSLGRKHLSMLGRNLEEGERKGAHTRMVGAARIGVGMEAGLLKTEAGLEARRIGLGQKMAGVMVQLNTASLNAAQSVANFSGKLEGVAAWMAGFTKDIAKVTESGTFAGTWSAILSALTRPK